MEPVMIAYLPFGLTASSAFASCRPSSTGSKPRYSDLAAMGWRIASTGMPALMARSTAGKEVPSVVSTTMRTLAPAATSPSMSSTWVADTSFALLDS